MKAIILCAGKSTRMYPLTITRPKPLIKVLNKEIIEHTLESLTGLIDEAIIVVGYKKEMIKEKIGNRFGKIKITYVEQAEQLGTGHAVLCAKKHLKKGERFIIIPGDDLFSKNDIKSCLKHEYSILAKEVSDPEKWGIIVKDKKGFMADIEEKPKNPKSSLASTGLMVVNYGLISLLERQEKTSRGEIEIPSALKEFSKTEKVYVQKVEDYWLPLGYPWHILDATEFLMKRMKKNEIKGKVGKNVYIDGKLYLGKGSIILPGTYIEGNVIIGENCRIGPNAYIRGQTVIGNNCRIGPAEIKNSVFFDNVRCDHKSYVGDSILSDFAHLGVGTATANLRHDHANIKSMVNGVLVDTGRRKLGAIIGDKVDTGINTSIYPGRKLWPNTKTIPGESVQKDKVD